MDRVPLAIAATVVVGGLIAFQPAVNSQLARHVSVIGAAFVSTAVSAVVLLVVYLAIKGGFGELSAMRDVPWYEVTGGVLGAILVTVSLVTVRTLGAGGVVAATVAGQLIVSALLDRAASSGWRRSASRRRASPAWVCSCSARCSSRSPVADGRFLQDRGPRRA